MQPTIKTIASKKLIGMSVKMSLIDNKTVQLFKAFQPRRKEIATAKLEKTYDLRTYSEDYFLHFNPAKIFTKWVLVEVKEVNNIPNKMEVFELESGEYAVFHYKGLSNLSGIFQYIFTEWLPNSNYELDNRPHFEVLTAKTKLNDPNSEEEIWIPIK